MSIADARRFFGEHVDRRLARRDRRANRASEVGDRLRFLSDVGLDYLSLDRSAETLSGGEAQRIRLASQIGSGLVGVMYILDEPSIGLHQRDNQRLLRHARCACATSATPCSWSSTTRMRSGRPITSSTSARAPACTAGSSSRRARPMQIAAAPDSLTGQYLSGRRRIAMPAEARARRSPDGASAIVEARGNNLRSVDCELSARADDVRDRRVGLGQVHAGHRHAVPERGAHS